MPLFQGKRTSLNEASQKIFLSYLALIREPFLYTHNEIPAQGQPMPASLVSGAGRAGWHSNLN